jgi:DUF4097 and DUF4098 domain-containing protein YvlB
VGLHRAVSLWDHLGMADDVVMAPGRAPVRVTTASGRVTVVGEARDDIVAVTTGGRREATPSGSGIEVAMTTSSDGVEIRCPSGTDVMVGSASGRVELLGDLGAVRVTTGSGSIVVESVTSADLRTQSAHIEVGSCLGACRLSNTSGRVDVHEAASVWIKGVSGTIDVTADDVHVRTISGTVRAAAGSAAAIETVSGDVDITVPPGFRPRIRSGSIGRIDVEVPQGDDGEIAVRSVSARIRVRSR